MKKVKKKQLWDQLQRESMSPCQSMDTMSEYGEGRYGAFPAAGGRHEPEGEPDGRTGQVGRNPPTYPVLTENEINGVCYPEVTFVVWA